MCDYEISLEEAASFVGNVSKLYREYVEAALVADGGEQIVEIALSMTGERRTSGLIINLGSPSENNNSLWGKVQEEVHEFLCTKSAAYREERIRGANNFQNLVHVTATAVGSTVSVGFAILSGLVSIALILVAKIGKNAWCKQYAALASS